MHDSHARMSRFFLLCLMSCGAESAPVQPSLDTADTATAAPPDAEYGRWALLNEDYIQCGVPASVYDQYIGAASPAERLPERDGRNAELPYYMTAVTADNGAELVAQNCLFCHAAFMNGELVVGLGNPWLDFTTDTTAYAAAMPLLAADEAEREEAEKWSERVMATSGSLVTDTVGSNPADTLAQALFAHRDPTTLAWSSSPMMELPSGPIPTDVPPLWNMAKKDRMLYSGTATGDLPRVMMTASALCTDDVEDAEEIYTYFDDIAAYFTTLQPPPIPDAIDQTLADQGQVLFEDSCAMCHGTYGDEPTYPGELVGVDEIGTDPSLALQPTDILRFVDWFNESWYGETAQLAPTGAYIAPPLDGIWATAPYLHNGSVPDLASLLDSSLRPTYWRRSTTYDTTVVGWRSTTLDEGKDEASDPTRVIDTTLPGWSNAGHIYGDELDAEQRAAVLEYLKTL